MTQTSIFLYFCCFFPSHGSAFVSSGSACFSFCSTELRNLLPSDLHFIAANNFSLSFLVKNLLKLFVFPIAYQRFFFAFLASSLWLLFFCCLRRKRREESREGSFLLRHIDGKSVFAFYENKQTQTVMFALNLGRKSLLYSSELLQELFSKPCEWRNCRSRVE